MDASPRIDGVFHSVCPHDCLDSCSMLSTVKEGELVNVRGNPDHPVTQDFLFRKFSEVPKRIYGRDRLLYPLKRTGPKGDRQFERITWEEAVTPTT